MATHLSDPSIDSTGEAKPAVSRLIFCCEDTVCTKLLCLRLRPCSFSTKTCRADLTCMAGEGLRRLEYRVGKWDRDLAAYLKTLRERKPIVVCGDLNCAHHEIDIHSPKTNLCVCLFKGGRGCIAIFCSWLANDGSTVQADAHGFAMQAFGGLYGRGARLLHDCDPGRRIDGLLQAATPRDCGLLVLWVSHEHAIEGQRLAPRLQPGEQLKRPRAPCCVHATHTLSARCTVSCGYGSVRSQLISCGAQVSDDLLDHVHDCYIMHEYPGSDHCPCGIIIKQ